MTSGLIQYGVPVTERTPVLDMQMVWSRLLAPKSPSFTLPAESRRMLAPERTGGSDQGEQLACNGPKDLWSSFPLVIWLQKDLQAIIGAPKLLEHKKVVLKKPQEIVFDYVRSNARRYLWCPCGRSCCCASRTCPPEFVWYTCVSHSLSKPHKPSAGLWLNPEGQRPQHQCHTELYSTTTVLLKKQVCDDTLQNL